MRETSTPSARQCRGTSELLAPARLLVAAAPRLFVLLIAIQIADSTVLTVVVYVGKRLVDSVVATTSSVPAVRPLAWVAIECALLAVYGILGQLSAYWQLVLGGRLGLHVNTLLLEKVSNVSYRRFEDSAFCDALEGARGASMRAIGAVTRTLEVLRLLVVLAGYSALLWSVGWWTVPVLLVTSAPRVVVETRFGRQLFELRRARAARTRKVSYLESIMLAESTVKEVKLLSLATPLIERYREIYRGFFLEEERAARVQRMMRAVIGSTTTLLLYVAYGYFVSEAARGVIGLGTMTLSIVALRQAQGALDGGVAALTGAYEEGLAMGHVLDVLSLPDDDLNRPLVEQVAHESAPTIEFDDVSFRYPGSTHDTLQGIRLKLRAGETLAIVGHNGAGKTTLVKLLTRLHNVTKGRILIDGVDIETMNTADLRARIGVVFQDFARFQLSLRDNVGFGWTPSLSADDKIDAALEKAGGRTLASGLRAGIDTPLGKVFDGDELSGGQWQRVALARAFMRECKILVLDEPTAAVDVETEHEIFERLRQLKTHRTALLITHRFSSVRMADRIVVLDKGRLVEDGTHDELMMRAGAYAGMFRRQADGYRG